MTLTFSNNAWEDYLYWQQTDKSILKKINVLIRDIQRDPFVGKGKPEALKYELAGYWSRRIDLEHRLIYSVEKDNITVVSYRYHY